MIERFTASIPQADLDDLERRLAATRWAPEEPAGAAAGSYGVPLARVRRLASRWRELDWRRCEERLNAHPQFLTRIDGQPVHFLHVRSAEPDALPVILSHGWPGSIFEYLDLVDRLVDPVAHGGEGADAFHVVLPSLPGYGFSGPALTPGWGVRRIAAAWAELMSLLGYERFGAIGNDAGSMISPELGRLEPDRVVGVHVTQLFSFPSGDPEELTDLDQDEQRGMETLQWFWQHKGAFNTLQGQQPQTLAHALADSPVGLLAWNAQLFDEALDDEFVLANVALYWLTGTGATSIRHYYEDAHAGAPRSAPTTVPIGLAAASAGDFRSIRRLAQRDHHRITSWTELAGVSGHYSAHTNPDQLAADIRRFFRPLRATTRGDLSAVSENTFDVVTESLDLLRDAASSITDANRASTTPCSQWTVTQVLQHAAGDQLAWAAALGVGSGPAENPFAPSGRLEGSVADLLDPALGAARTAWAGIGRDGEAVPTPLPQGALPAATAAAACALDAAVHGWDIGVAVGQPGLLTDELAASLLPAARAIVEPLRQFGAYAPALTPQPGDGSAAELLRFLGRDPRWAPASA
jgi:uncharacterized protein (TIGR03086 family)